MKYLYFTLLIVILLSSCKKEKEEEENQPYTRTFVDLTQNNLLGLWQGARSYGFHGSTDTIHFTADTLDWIAHYWDDVVITDSCGSHHEGVQFRWGNYSFGNDSIYFDLTFNSFVKTVDDSISCQRNFNEKMDISYAYLYNGDTIFLNPDTSAFILTGWYLTKVD